MPTTLTSALETVLDGFDPTALRAATTALIEVYRSGDRPPGLVLDDAVTAAAYAAYRMPATHAAVARALAQATRLGPALEVRSVLDVGGGTGAATWAVAEALPTVARVEVVDGSPVALELGRRLARYGPAAVAAATWTRAVLRQDFTPPVTDLAVLSYVVGELAETLQRAIIRALTTSARWVLVVEPGTPRGFATVLSARALLTAAGWHVLAPCPQDGPCPLAAHPGDWCHFAARLQRTTLHRRLKGAALGHEDEKFSYVLASRDPVAPAPGRVLRHPVRRKGLVQLQVCRPEATAGPVVVTRRDANAYRTARDVVWGDAFPPLPG